jgi:hypothetical protein
MRKVVDDPAVQRALLATRQLRPNSYAAEVLGASRQALHNAIEREPGRGGWLLAWEFRRGGWRRPVVFIDFGRIVGDEDATAWHGSDPDSLIAQSRAVYGAVLQAPLGRGAIPAAAPVLTSAEARAIRELGEAGEMELPARDRETAPPPGVPAAVTPPRAPRSKTPRSPNRSR